MTPPKPPFLKIGSRILGDGQSVFLIAEIGVNHNGSMQRAKELIDIAAGAGADAVKFQKRHLSATYLERVIADPNKEEQGFTYLLPILKECEFGRDDYADLVRFAASKNVIFLCTPFDEPSVDFLEQFDLPAYKVASADMTNFVLLERLIAAKKPLILSTGMSVLGEIDATVKFLEKRRASFMLLHCNSTYPAPLEDLNLRFIEVLKKRYGVPIGYSGHEPVIGPSLAAVSLGAAALERHVTLDRGMEGPDHAASLEPHDLRLLIKCVRDVEKAMGRPVKIFNRGEILNREVLGKSLVAASALAKGAMIGRHQVTAKSPGKGLSPQCLYDLVGRRSTRDMNRDDVFFESDLGRSPVRLKIPNLKSHWGLKSRFAELDFAETFRSPVVEFHMSDKDLEFSWDTGRKFDQALVVHAPEYMGRRLVDLSNQDHDLRSRAVATIQKTIDITRVAAKSFKGMPKVVIHVGGMDLEPKNNREILLDAAAESFRRLDSQGVALLPENLPPQPWYFSGQWYQNVFCSSKDMVYFCRQMGLKMTFDFSHAQLFCNATGESLDAYAKEVSPFVSHLHVADGAGVQGEGLQIGDGEIDFERIFASLGAPRWSWVPEIWRGHQLGYRGFIVALQRLSKIKKLRNPLRQEKRGAP
ncbi:MAG: N-acetylneuraminate synthase family protein [Elusimicrobia bacterium]|nr:N-acetylneuraminate synthase family protein [Elusimicrobiota bacterium]